MAVRIGTREVRDQIRAHVDQKRVLNEPPDRMKLLELELTRQDYFNSAMEQLKKELGPTSWDGLHSYLNDDFRMQIRQIPIPLSPAKDAGDGK